MTTSSNSSPNNDPWQHLRDWCAPELFCVPKTWSDPFRPSHEEMPLSLKAVIVYMQNNVAGKPWCNALALLSLIMMAQHVNTRTILGTLSHLHNRFEQIFSVLDLQVFTDWKADTHLMLYLTGQIVEANTQSQRALFWRYYRASSRRANRWLTSLPAEQQDLYRPHVLPYPHASYELTKASGEQQVYHDQREKRKADTDALMPFYADLRTHGHFRYNLIRRLLKAYRQAIERVEAGQAELPLTFAVTEAEHEPTGQGSPVRLLFKLWDRQTLGKHHLTAFSRGRRWAVQHQSDSFSDEKNTYLLEFVRAEGVDETSTPSKPWFIELLEQDVLGNISQTKGHHKKKEWLTAHGYEIPRRRSNGPFSPHTSGVLIPPQRTGYRQFLSCLREKVEITLVPIEALHVAATFGMVALCILTANGMRVGELLQIRATADGIVPITLAPPPDAEDQRPTIHWAVQAVPKGHHTPKTYYLDDEHLRLLSLIKLMLCDHYQIDPQTGGELPKVFLRGKIRYTFPDADHYLFQYSGSGMYESDIAACLRFLLHGLVFHTLDGRQVIVYPHLLRHGFATWAINVAKEPVDIVAAILHQKNVNVTKYYGRPNPRLIAERSHGLMRQISSYIDVTELTLRGPEELRELLQKAKRTHGTLNRIRGGRCLLCGECPIFFACIGCSAKVPDPAQRGEVEETKQVVLIQIEQARKKGLTLEVAQYEKKLRQCDAELREMEMMEAARADEAREPEVDFDVEG